MGDAVAIVRFLFTLLRPPSSDEWRRLWPGILTGLFLATLMALGDVLFEEWNGFPLTALEAIFFYVISMLAVIGVRIKNSEKDE